jgi:hypothetical protein
MVAALLAIVGVARAQTVVIGVGPGRGSAQEVDVSMTGSLVVSFHGDQGTGCAARGLCAYSGIVVWRPGPQSHGLLEITTLRSHGRRVYTANLSLFPNYGGGADVSAEVRRSIAGQSPGICADTSSQFRSSALPVNDGVISLAVLGGGSSILSTRCAGPVDADIAPVLATPLLPVRLALRGHRQVDLGEIRSFAANGLAGTVSSTIVLHLGETFSVGRGGGSSGGERYRLVTAPLTLVKASGSISAQLRGTADRDVCVLLDSCGTQGTITVHPQPQRGQGQLTAYGPARLPYRDFLAALGLGRHANANGIVVQGVISWDSGGILQTDIAQGGECKDSTPLGFGAVYFGARRGQVTAQYAPRGSARARCPGPRLFAVRGAGYLADGTFPTRDLGRGEFSIPLRPDATFSDDGYAGHLAGSLSLTIRRGRFTQRIITQ